MSEAPDQKNPGQSLLSSIEAISAEADPAQKAALDLMAGQVHELIAALDRTQSDVQEAKNDKAKFVSVVTHELRIPLTSIKGYTDLLRQGIVGPVNEQQTNFLNVIRGNVERMTALISDLSDMSHIQSGRLKIQPKTVRIHDQIGDITKHWEPIFAEKQQVLHVEVSSELDSMAIDPDRFNQVLGYLLNNGQRYSPEGETVDLRVSPSGENVRVEVQDRGIGISDDDQRHVFESFFRSEDAQVRDHPGWGLSLHVAMLLVNLMGGEMGFASKLNAGSTFWFTIPVFSR